MAEGLDEARVGSWLAEHVDGATAPFAFRLIAAGGSNLTFEVTDAAGRRWALRRPPVAAVLATAHDMSREWRIISALDAGSDVPVPAAVAFCSDPDVTGAPFSVMGFVDGLILRDQQSAAHLTAARCEVATDSLVDTQVMLHALDVDRIGLGDLGRRAGYVERQLNRWRTQYERSKSRELPLVDELHDRLLACVPREQRPGAIAHGDYRFDNTMLGDDCRIAAVFDWELCTLGEAVADFCWSLMYWADPGDEVGFLQSPPTALPTFPRRAEVAARYAARSGLDLSDLPYYQAFSWWKMACIVEGAYARRRAGARGGARDSSDADAIARRVEELLEAGHAAASHAML